MDTTVHVPREKLVNEVRNGDRREAVAIDVRLISMAEEVRDAAEGATVNQVPRERGDRGSGG